MTIDFPNNPGYGSGETSTFNYSVDGIIQSWYWGETGDNPVEAWIPVSFSTPSGGEGGIGSQGFQGFQGATGPPGNGGAANPEGPNGSIQFNDSGSLSGISEVGIFTDDNLSPNKGLSGNILKYSESLSSDTQTINSTTTKTIGFGSYNILSIPNVALEESQKLTIEGLSPSVGASLTVILGHTGASGSSIIFPGDIGVYWANGPANGGLTTGDPGFTAYIYPSTVKNFDILYFFSDGSNIFGNHQKNYSQFR